MINDLTISCPVTNDLSRPRSEAPGVRLNASDLGVTLMKGEGVRLNASDIVVKLMKGE